MSDAIENETHCTPPKLTQIAANSMQDLIPPKSRKESETICTKSISLSQHEADNPGNLRVEGLQGPATAFRTAEAATSEIAELDIQSERTHSPGARPITSSAGQGFAGSLVYTVQLIIIVFGGLARCITSPHAADGTAVLPTHTHCYTEPSSTYSHTCAPHLGLASPEDKHSLRESGGIPVTRPPPEDGCAPGDIPVIRISGPSVNQSGLDDGAVLQSDFYGSAIAPQYLTGVINKQLSAMTIRWTPRQDQLFKSSGPIKVWASKMEDGWESHVSPLVMGVGMGDLQGMGEMQAPGQEMPVEMNMPHQHHQELASHPELNPAIHQDIEQDLGREMGRNDMRSHHEGLGGHDDYFSHQELAQINLFLTKIKRRHGIEAAKDFTPLGFKMLTNKKICVVTTTNHYFAIVSDSESKDDESDENILGTARNGSHEKSTMKVNDEAVRKEVSISTYE
ncbi:hypothetical protein GEV33_002828 [Tenebrio molitor]|uniref:Uncharacterized protein n=1 Tax=Tenebrio molitor TaxID=7067 RepID=A0A8J6HUR6_TENMO|nr:hypothetical protein GEV33_002828 [Tenebrio molitor]